MPDYLKLGEKETLVEPCSNPCKRSVDHDVWLGDRGWTSWLHLILKGGWEGIKLLLSLPFDLETKG